MVTSRKLMTVAAELGVDKNPLYQAAADQYEVQLKTLELVNRMIEQTADDPALCLSYIKQIPAHTEKMNGTLRCMVKIVEALSNGDKKKVNDKLASFLGGDDDD